MLAAGRRRGYEVAVVSTPADVGAPVRREADRVLETPDFLDAAAVVEAARTWGADLLHPGYGFLSENADFAARVEAAGIAFVGPDPESMRLLGNKEAARKLAVEVGVPVLSDELRFPVAVKAAAGGGGIGIRVVRRREDLEGALEAAAAQARAAFGDGAVFVERWLERPRHVEIQVFGDGRGGGAHFGERECSVQRRRQKLLEWAPAAIGADLRSRMAADALKLVSAARYRGAGTVEFLVEGEEHWFLEVNARLQVEHPVTEAIAKVDLVDLQLELAEGGRPAPQSMTEPQGAAIEARVLAESPDAGFAPSPKPVRRWRPPAGVRCDSGIEDGAPVPAGFDSLLAKVIATGASFEEARRALVRALGDTVLHGPETNLGFLRRALAHPDFREGRTHTGWVEERLDELTATEPSRFPDRAAETLRDAASGRRPDPAAGIFRSPGAPENRPGERPGEVRIGDEPAVVTELPDGVAVTRAGATEVLRESGPAAAGRAGGARDVEAPLSGTLLRVRDEPGVAVQEGEVVAVVESMKMHWEVRAPGAGVLEAPEARAGDQVSAGTVLVRLRPA